VAQEIASGRITKEQARKVQASLPPEQQQAVLQALDGMKKGSTGGQAQQASGQQTPQEAKPEPYRKPSGVESVAKAIARPVVEGVQSEIVAPMVGEAQRKIQPYAEAAVSAGLLADRAIEKAKGLLSKFHTSPKIAKAVQEQKLRESLDEVRAAISALEAEDSSAGRNKKLREAKSKAKGLAAMIVQVRGG
jgi:hypothetical protein